MATSAVLRRLILAVPTLFGVAVVVFLLIRVVPGDPVAMMVPPGASEDDIAALRARYGLDLSLWSQFWIWLQGVVVGDFGTSISLRQDVLGLVLSRLPATLELAGLAFLIALVIGMGLALVGARLRGSFAETAIDSVNGVSLAVPDFIWALALVLVFGVFLGALPISGRLDPRAGLEFATQFYLVESLVTLRFDAAWGLLRHMLMPALALALPLAAVITRIFKDALKEALLQDYVLLARIKGKSDTRILIEEVARNALVPTIALTGVQLTFLIGGTVIVERIFSYPGIGNMAIDAVINRDLPLIQGIVLTFGVLFILVNLLVDLTYAALNPRLRHG
ncbi:MAG: ABC transporter permease [Pseudomonadota bacterium]